MIFALGVATLIFTKRRSTFEIIPETWKNFWNQWELRLLVLSSLLLQIVLIIAGNRRKYMRRDLASIILWLTYLAADSVATLSLGILSHSPEAIGCRSNPNYVIMAFWAPIFLLHLGGPDTITAYSLEDNELWLRHLLGLGTQFGVALIVFHQSWTSASIHYLAIPMFIVGLIKYGERTWVLRSSSRDQFRDSLVSPPDPGPNYAKFMDDYVSKKAEGYRIELGRAINVSEAASHLPTYAKASRIIPNGPTLNEAYYFYNTFRKLFTDLILSFQDKINSHNFFHKREWDKVFEVIEVELGFMYDILYTKASLIYSDVGFWLRSITSSLTLLVLVAFVTIDKSHYSIVEVGITYLLLAGAIVLEVYAVIIMLASDQAMRWFSEDEARSQGRLVCLICKMVYFFRKYHMVPSERRWSNSMGQYNLLSVCLKERPAKFGGIQKFLCIYEWKEKNRYNDSESVPKGLKALIFKRLKERIASSETNEDNKQSYNYRGDQMMLKWMNYFASQSSELEFDESILLWHIATDLCYFTDPSYNSDSDERLKHEARKWLLYYMLDANADSEEILRSNEKFRREVIRLLSDYMLYLLVMYPSMLPGGIGPIRLKDTRAEAEEFFEERKYISNRKQACEKLLQVSTVIPPSEVKGDRSKSVLFDACRLAKCLQSQEEKWEIIVVVWLDILSYAAAQCRWNDHAQQLRRGGQLLTHVWLLMAHLGMTNHFQISQGYLRAKLQTR